MRGGELTAAQVAQRLAREVVSLYYDPATAERVDQLPVGVLDDDDLDDLSGIRTTAHQFQRWVPKLYDCRVIAIGGQLFTFAIHAGNTKSYVDFRADYDALSYEPIELPVEIAEGIRRFLGMMGLVYGALDFVVDPKGSFSFIECNSGGHFGWLEARTGAPLTETLADLLAKGARS